MKFMNKVGIIWPWPKIYRQSSLIIPAGEKSSEADHPRPHHASTHLRIALFSPLEPSPPSVPPQCSPLFPGPQQAAASSQTCPRDTCLL